MEGGVEEEPPAPAVFLPRLDDGKGPVLPLASSADAKLVHAALIASGFSTEALASLSASSSALSAGGSHQEGRGTQLREETQLRESAERASGEFLRGRVKARPSSRPLLGTAGRGAIILAILGSSTAAAALTLEWPRVKAAWTRVWEPAPEESGAASDTAKFRAKALSHRPSRSGVSEAPRSLAVPQTEPAAVASAAVASVAIEPAVAEPAASALLQAEPGAANDRGADPSPRALAVGRAAAQREGVTLRSAALPEQAVEQEPAKAEDLLGAANALRAERRYPEALEKYTAVLRVYPRSAQARAARVAAATLRLERLNDAKGARELLSEATSTDVAAAEAGSGKTALPEAEFALAEAHRAAGDDVAERNALLRFVKRYPDHPLFTVAERRLRELQRALSSRNAP